MGNDRKTYAEAYAKIKKSNDWKGKVAVAAGEDYDAAMEVIKYKEILEQFDGDIAELREKIYRLCLRAEEQREDELSSIDHSLGLSAGRAFNLYKGWCTIDNEILIYRTTIEELKREKGKLRDEYEPLLNNALAKRDKAAAKLRKAMFGKE